jgi:hypothetical protein
MRGLGMHVNVRDDFVSFLGRLTLVTDRRAQGCARRSQEQFRLKTS